MLIGCDRGIARELRSARARHLSAPSLRYFLFLLMVTPTAFSRCACSGVIS